ncbi:hypothetical protein [Paracoccus sp. N5]|uniref:hypothetical protein n=1 Tax=Paracoccus sp. N5 TaxID=1101189 RepID=UPI00039D6A72|nr:hypothetical protein [Paracoccus sp. N5]
MILSRDAQADLRDRLFGFVFQQYNLIPTQSALENVKLPVPACRAQRGATGRRACGAAWSWGTGCMPGRRRCRRATGAIAAISILVGGIGVMTSCSPPCASARARSASAPRPAPRCATS